MAVLKLEFEESSDVVCCSAHGNQKPSPSRGCKPNIIKAKILVKVIVSRRMENMPYIPLENNLFRLYLSLLAVLSYFMFPIGVWSLFGRQLKCCQKKLVSTNL